MLNPSKPSFINAEMKFGSKFRRGFRLAADNRPDIWLAYAYNPVFNRMCLIVIHILLLFIQQMNGNNLVTELFGRGIALLHKPVDVFQVTTDVTQLCADGSADLLARGLFSPRKRKILFVGNPAICPWLR